MKIPGRGVHVCAGSLLSDLPEKTFWKSRSIAFLFFLSGMAGFLIAMSVSIEAVQVERNLAAMNGLITKGQSREKILEDSLIDLTKESRLRAYAKSNQLTRALPSEVLYLP